MLLSRSIWALDDVCSWSRNAGRMEPTDTLRMSKSSAVVFKAKPFPPMNQGGEHCLSAVPGCWEKAHSLYNSKPIFCPSHHFIPVLKLSSGPNTVTFWHALQLTSTMPANIVSSSELGAPQPTFNKNSKSSLIEHPTFLPTPIWKDCSYVWKGSKPTKDKVRWFHGRSHLIRWPKQFSRIILRGVPCW